MFWSSQTIKAKQEETTHKKLPLLHPYDADRVVRGAYELALNRNFLITPDGSTDNSCSQDNGAIKIPPGQFALLYTVEWVNIPPDVIAFISLKGSVKFKGLINISGFQVDPGFPGHLKFSVYNASGEDVNLNFEEPCFLIWFATLDKETDDYQGGQHRLQKGFTTQDRDRMSEPRYSPETLHKKLREIEDRVGMISAVGLVVIIPLVIGLVSAMFDHWFGEKTDSINDRGLIICTALIVGSVVLLLNWIFSSVLKRLFRWLKNRFHQK